MKLVGAVLILVGVCIGYLDHRRNVLYMLRLTRTLTEDLTVLRCQICIHRRSLPMILASEMSGSVAGKDFWMPLATHLEQSGDTMRRCWEQTAGSLPDPLGGYLAPLGVLLPVGGDTLSCAIDEVREELLDFARKQQETQNAKLRLSAAMCFSAAALLILVCI